MNRKSKGIGGERELIHKFWKNGWAAIRIAGSGSNKYPSPDILAGNSLRKIAIECKVVNDFRKYFPNHEIEELILFSKIFGAEPWIGVKFQRDTWYFVPANELDKTKSSCLITQEKAKLTGLIFEELI